VLIDIVVGVGRGRRKNVSGTLGDPSRELPMSTTCATCISTHFKWWPGPWAGDETHCMKCCHTLDPMEWAIKHTCKRGPGSAAFRKDASVVG